MSELQPPSEADPQPDTGSVARPAQERPPASRHSAVKAAAGPRYGRGAGAPGARAGRASDSFDPAYRRAGPDTPPHASNALQRNRTYAVLSALPVLMLLIGLAWHYLGERRQSVGAPIAEQSVHLVGEFDGLTRIGSSGQGRHYLWLQTDTRRRGVRVVPSEVPRLRSRLASGERIEIDAAPSVDGSNTRWLWRLTRDGTTLLDDSARLR